MTSRTRSGGPARPTRQVGLTSEGTYCTRSFSILTYPVAPKPQINRLRPDGFPKVTKLHCTRGWPLTCRPLHHPGLSYTITLPVVRGVSSVPKSLHLCSSETPKPGRYCPEAKRNTSTHRGPPGDPSPVLCACAVVNAGS